MSEADTRAVRPGYLRVAVAQIHYHAAIATGSVDPLADPLHDLKHRHLGAALLPPGENTAPLPLQERWNGLRQRARAAYTSQLGARVQEIVQACRTSGVRLLVFPEYSIPPSLLSALASMSSGMVIVAGSHFANLAGPDADTYGALGFNGDPDKLHGCNVSPVLFDGRLIALVPKLHPAKLELGLVEPGSVASWAPVELSEEFGGSLGVLICLDYLDREGDVVALAKRCRLLATPTLTPTRSIHDDFGPAAFRDARRLHKPVLRANLAAAGGSAVYVDEGQETDLRLFPDHAGLLDADEEGVIIADIDMQLQPPGDSTPYAATRPVIPHAAASLVYTCAEPQYAAWCAELAALLGDEKSSAVQRLRGARRLIQERPPPLPSRESARRRRLTLLLQDIGEESSLERVRQLTREILLPETIVPLAGIRAALARGAADEIHRWLADPSLTGGAFGPVETTLRGAWASQAKTIAHWSEPARRVLADVSAQVRGGPEPVPRERVELRLMRIEKALIDGLDEGEPEALALLEKGSFSEARARFQKLLARAEQGASEPASPELRARIARFRLRIAAASLNLQEVQAAGETLAAVDADALPWNERLLLVEALALVGELPRAEALLPAQSAILPELHEKYQAAAQTLSILRGELPQEVARSAPVHLRAAVLALSRNDMARAAREALAALELEEGALTVAQAVLILTSALGRSVNELPPDVLPIPAAARGTVIETVEQRLGDLAGRALPEPITRRLAWHEPHFRALVHDEEALATAPHPREVRLPGMDDGGFQAIGDQLFDLVKQGKTAEAIALLPPDEHPWRRRLNRVDLWRSGGERARALEEALDLVRDHPGKAPVEYAAATLLFAADRKEEALTHAHRAFEALPGIGQRLAFAQCLLAVGQAERAWTLLQPIRASRRLAALQMLAKAADDTRRTPEVVAFLRAILERTPDDVNSRLVLAQRLAYLHRNKEAADLAWQTFEAHRDRLDLRELTLCGTLQRLPGPELEGAEDRIKRIAEVIHERFPENAHAEHARLALLRRGGRIPADVAPIQFDRLVEAGLAYRGRGVDELVGWMRRRHESEQRLQAFARAGAIPAWVLCEQLGASLPLLLTRLLDDRRDVPAPWCPPVRYALRRGIDLRGATVLLSDLEISLIHGLDQAFSLHLWRSLKERLAGGRIVLPAAAYHRIQFALADAMTVDRAELERLDRWIARVDLFAPQERRAGETDDAAVSLRLGVPLIDAVAPEGHPRISPRALLRRLREDGVLDASQAREIERSLPEETGPEAPLPSVPPSALLGASMLRSLLATETLLGVARAFSGGLLLGPVAVASLRSERMELEERVRAAALAEVIHRAVANAQEEGWLRVYPGEEPLVPSLREGATEMDRALVLAPTREALAIHETLEKNAAWLRVTADFFGDKMVVIPQTLSVLTWDPVAFDRVSERMAELEARTLSIPELLREISKDAEALQRALRWLARLGFSDALGADEMLRLERLDRGEAARLLERQEWVARSADHVDADRARVWVARTHGDMLVRAFVTESGEHSPERSEAEKQALARAVLSRIADLADQTRSGTLDYLFVFLGLATLTGALWSWERGEGDEAHLRADGPVALLWRIVGDWVGSHPSRRGALGRALRELWGMLDGAKETEREIDVPTLSQAMEPVVGTSLPDRFLLEPEVEALAILSALWSGETFFDKQGVDGSDPRSGIPFHITYAEMLRHGARLLHEPRERWVDERAVAFEMPVPGAEGVIHVRAPVEALLLRAEEPATRRLAAAMLKVMQGPHDGALYPLLAAIEAEPENIEHLRSYARRASRSLFRLVRDDPGYLAIWPCALRVHEPLGVPDLAALRSLLSEPEPRPTEDLTPAARLHERMMTESGAWRERADNGSLFLQACEIPGLLPGMAVAARLDEPTYAGQVAIALERLDHAEDHPIARVAGDVLFLRAAVASKPMVRLPRGEINLSEELPGRLVRLLDSLRSDPKTDTMAASEAPLLRLCGDVVRGLARYRPLPVRERLWLTYRLFQWLCTQLDALSSDARRAALLRLTALAPPPEPPEDLLDPFGFDRGRFDHRLAAILRALAAAEQWARAPGGSPVPPDAAVAPRAGNPNQSISSPELESLLARIAEEVAPTGSSTSKLDWGSLSNVPDLALDTLLFLNPSALGSVSVEARMRRWETLPLDAVDGSAEGAFAWRLLAAVADGGDVLSAEERATLEARLRSMPAGPTAQLWRWVAWVGLLAAGERHLEEEARALLEEHVCHPLAPLLAGRFLVQAVSEAPERLSDRVDWLRGVAGRAGANVVDVTVTAVVRVALRGSPAAKKAAFAVLRRLAREVPFADDPGMRNVIGFFHLTEPST